MIEGLTFKVTHDASPKTTPAEGRRNVNACQLRDPLAKKPHPAAGHRLSISNSDDQKPRGKDQVVARLVSKDRIDLGRHRRPTIVPTHNVLPIGPQGSLSKFRRWINRDHSRVAMRRCHARSLTTDRPVSRTMSNIEFRRANFPQSRRGGEDLTPASSARRLRGEVSRRHRSGHVVTADS